ncbi:MAG: hypothetical protein A2X22_03125 [Bacteroidetes bacterium GWF2_49_14]|nr:MAG: hypothetical protein A2X22_03125 [Bacteroidetes bacterium GWF2_49_14]
MGLTQGSTVLPADKEQNPNVLFISIDDLRPELGCYGNPVIRTPNLDRLASMGMVFTKTFCQVAVSAPSRASLFTGLRPDSVHVWGLEDKFRNTMPDVKTLPKYLHQYGYYTVGIGKIFHNFMPDSVSFDEPDLRPDAYKTPDRILRDAESFHYDEAITQRQREIREAKIKKNPAARQYADGWGYGSSVEVFEGPDSVLYDGAQTELAIRTLSRLKNSDQPFFMALGYYRPHLPFVAPRKYFDLYDPSTIPLAANPFLPADAPVMAADNQYELAACYDLAYVKHPRGFTLCPDSARILKQGYYASVSYVDACIGRLMQEMDKMGLLENTVIVVWGDNGWKLGEHNSWTKQTNYNIDTRVPLIIYTPDLKKRGKTCSRLTELVDLFPTVCELAKVKMPDYAQGTSLVPLLKDPARPWKPAVFSQFHRKPNITPDKKRYMGYSMVTPEYHYVEWRYWDYEKKLPGERVAMELYDLSRDPDENHNLAVKPEYAETLTQLAAQMKAGWKSARPVSVR